MRNLNKSIASMVGAAMVLGPSVGVAFAQTAPSTISYSDVTASTAGQTAISELSALGVVQGVGYGSFDPSGPVTRAEFAKMLDIAIGLGPAAQAEANSPSNFSDVSTSAWYDGYVAVAASQGIVEGYGNGMFGPNDPVTYAQAVTMVVRALGYEPVVTGPWPSGYLAEANQILNSNGAPNLLQGLSGVTSINQPLNRAQTAELVANALYSQLASTQYTTGTNLPGQSVKVTPPGTTLLGRLGYSAAYPGATANGAPEAGNYTGLVVATPNSDSSLLADQINVEIPNGSGGYYTQTLTAASTIGLVGSADLNGLLGTQISYAVNSATNQLVFAAVTNASTQVLTGTAVVANSNGESLGFGAGQVDNVTISVNGTTQNVMLAPSATLTGSGVQLPIILTQRGNSLVKNGDPLTVVLDSNGQAIVVSDQTYQNNDWLLTGTGTDVSNNYATVTAYNNGSPTTVDVAPGATVTLNGQPSTLSQVPTNAVISFNESNGQVTQVAASTSLVTGTLSGISNSGGNYYLTVAGQQYQVSTQASLEINGSGIESFTSNYNSLVSAVGENVSATVGPNGHLGFVTTTTGNLVYGLVTNNPTVGGYVTLETTAGQLVNYTYAPTASAPTLVQGDYVEVVLNTSSQISQITLQGNTTYNQNTGSPALNGNMLSVGGNNLLIAPNTPVFLTQNFTNTSVGSLASVGNGATIDYVTNSVGQVVEITVVGVGNGTVQTALVTGETTNIGTTSSSTLGVDLYGTTPTWSYAGDASGWGSTPYVLVATVNGTAITSGGAETVGPQTVAGGTYNSVSGVTLAGFNTGVDYATPVVDTTAPTTPAGLFVVEGTVTGTPNVGNNQYIQIKDASGTQFTASSGNGFLVSGSTQYSNNSNVGGTIGLGNLSVGTNVELVGTISNGVATVWYVVDNG